MTEAEWLGATDPEPMIEFLKGKVSDRKLRHFAVACCRRLWLLMGERAVSKIFDTAEDFADGSVGECKLSSIRSELIPRIRHSGDWVAGQVLYDLLDAYAGRAAQQCMSGILWFRYPFASEGLRHTESYQAAKERDGEKDRLIGLHYCVFGNPFRPAVVDPSWLTATVASLAESTYQDRAFDRMPILADALQDAGCDNNDVLNHCRQSGEHVRGCWVVDLVFGKK